MAEPDRTTPTSDSSFVAWQLMHLSFQIGFIKAMLSRCEQMLTILTVAKPPPSSGRMTWREALQRAKNWGEGLELVGRVWRLAPWGTLGWSAYQGLRWLGLLP
jgi:hypothetical protein